MSHSIEQFQWKILNVSEEAERARLKAMREHEISKCQRISIHDKNTGELVGAFRVCKMNELWQDQLPEVAKNDKQL